MTLTQVTDEYYELRPNSAFSKERVRSWICDVEGLIAREVLESDEVSAPDASTELSAPAPYDRLYVVYAIMMSEFYLGEYNKYNDTATAFGEIFGDFKKWYVRIHGSKKKRSLKIW